LPKIARPERLVNTERFDGEFDSGQTLVTTALAERDQRTTLTMTQNYV